MSKPKLILQVRANPLKKIEPGDTEVTYDPVKLETTPFIQVSFFFLLGFWSHQHFRHRSRGFLSYDIQTEIKLLYI